jgi:hypothetical protein
MTALDYNFRPGRERDAHGTPERREPPKRVCSCEGCYETAFIGSSLCGDHWQENQLSLQAEAQRKKATQSRAKASKSRQTSTALPIDVSTANSRQIASFDDSDRLEPVRYAPPQTELERARWRYQLSPQLSDDEVVALYRKHEPNAKGVSE